MRDARPVPLVVAVACVALLVLWAIFDRASVLQGWLVAAIAWMGIPLGAIVLTMAHTLTGGRWGEALRPSLALASGMAGLAALAFVPMVFGLPALFPWALSRAAAPTGVGAIYLNVPGLVIRSTVSLAGWTLLGLLFRGRRPPGVAAAGLLFTAVAVTAFSTDWVLSFDPGYPSSAFPATFAVGAVVTALAFCAVILPAGMPGRDCADLAGLLLAGLLGLVYLELMTYVVAWYGNLPEKAAWFLRRSGERWAGLLGVAALLGAVLPILLLLASRVRASRSALRIVGAAVLLGVFLHDCWLIAPEFGWRCVVPALLGAVGLGSLALALPLRAEAMGRPAHA